MLDNSYLELVNKRKELEISSILKCNEYTSKYGLVLNQNDIANIIESRKETLKDTGRIELRGNIIEKLIKEFCDSQYIIQDNYSETLYELIDIFYNYKNETMDLITDDELIDFMKRAFNGVCEGDLGYLSTTILYKAKENLLNGKPLDYIEKEDEQFE